MARALKYMLFRFFYTYVTIMASSQAALEQYDSRDTNLVKTVSGKYTDRPSSLRKEGIPQPSAEKVAGVFRRSIRFIDIATSQVVTVSRKGIVLSWVILRVY